MRLRTLALALALGCGVAAVGECRQTVPAQRPKPRKARKIKQKKLKKPKYKAPRAHRTA
jgi:hypothetical protein